MRHTIMGLAVAVSAGLSAAPAVAACGYGGCNTSGWNYNYSGFYGNHSMPSCGLPTCGWAGATWQYGHLPYPYQPYGSVPQYYYVNRGPTYTGPGLLAPAPTYRERAVSGWYGYGPTAYGTNYGYSGSPYGNATTHYYDGMPAQGVATYQETEVPAIRFFRPHHRHALMPRYYRSYRYGYGQHFPHHRG